MKIKLPLFLDETTKFCLFKIIFPGLDVFLFRSEIDRLKVCKRFDDIFKFDSELNKKI